MNPPLKVAFVGNPNVGKTSLLNYLTGSSFRVGNFPGVTVDKKSAHLVYKNTPLEFIDLPGIYSFRHRSLDEKIAVEFILNSDLANSADIFINVLDSNHLARHLYLTTYLIQLKKPFIIVLTKNDKSSFKELNLDILKQNLKVPIFNVDSNKETGKEDLLDCLLSKIEPPKNSFFPEFLVEKVEPLAKAIESFEPDIDSSMAVTKAFSYLEGNNFITQNTKAKDELESIKNQTLIDIKKHFVHDIIMVLAQIRYHFIDSVLVGIKANELREDKVTEKIDSYLLHRYLGFPLFILIMWFVFKVGISVGDAFQDFFDILSGSFFVDYLGHFLVKIPFLKLLLADGIGAGIQALATFIPNVFMVFFIMSILEDSGYLARITILIDRIMKVLGLPGKALAPLIMGFGCNVTSVLGSRILENPNERKITIAFSPFVSCGARLPVYTIIASALFVSSGGSVVASLYFIGIMIGILTALVLKKILYNNLQPSFLILELPSYRIPRFKTATFAAFKSVRSLMKRAFLLIVVFVALFQTLDHVKFVSPQQGFLAMTDQDNSVIRSLAKKMTKPLSFMGVSEKNWPASIGILNGILAKEAVVGAMVVSYKAFNTDKTISLKSAQHRQALTNLLFSVKKAFLSIPKNLVGFYNSQKVWQSGLLTSLGFYIPFYNIFHSSYLKETHLDDSNHIFKVMRESFENSDIKDPRKKILSGQLAAYSFLLFILLYTACIAVLAAIKKELGLKWMMGIFIYQTFLSYFVSVVFFQIGSWLLL